jgi:hypothetical protein
LFNTVTHGLKDNLDTAFIEDGGNIDINAPLDENLMDIVDEVETNAVNVDIMQSANSIVGKEIIEKLTAKEREALSKNKNTTKRMSFNQLMSNISVLLNKVDGSLKIKLKGKLKRSISNNMA